MSSDFRAFLEQVGLRSVASNVSPLPFRIITLPPVTFKLFFFWDIASPQHGDLRLSDPPSGYGAVAQLELATEGSLQISGWTCQPMCHQHLHLQATEVSPFEANISQNSLQ
ncbi:hypothetical protein PoB_000407700 [Plakobranchus ocellatus]|uniref:Uncharacterized protein n=1 Tax=Plakobranchus ocellatus TaxID=259542 RepID=A0AAV3Y610_9GAST|nr:hypothetical protein PoB_000407700 [Plakobranchus ocellatus]